ncbi:MAG: hypothetical protein WKF82_01165 [Nocardioidaceae bacterium]
MTSLLELRVLEGPNLYFPTAAIKLTLDISVLMSASEQSAVEICSAHRAWPCHPGRR